VQIEGIAGGRGLGHHRIVHEHRPLRPPGCPAGEVHEGVVLGRCGCRPILSGSRFHQARQRAHAVPLVLCAAVDQEDPAQCRQPVEDLRDLALEEGARRDETGALADLQPRPDRLRPEGREEGAEDGPSFEGSENGRIEGRDPAAQREHRFALAHAQRVENVGEAAGRLVEHGEADG
jgi:hypothetical protein